MATRLSITLTPAQERGLNRIAMETGASRQSMIGLAISAWLRDNDRLPEPEPDTEQEEQAPRRLYQRSELLAVLGDYVADYDVDGLEWAATTYDPQRQVSYWAVDQEGLLELLDKFKLQKKPATVCEICGAPADWASCSDDGTEHYFCDKH